MRGLGGVEDDTQEFGMEAEAEGTPIGVPRLLKADARGS